MFSITKKDWDKIINYAKARSESSDHEIGGMALLKCKKDKDGNIHYVVSEPTILNQETSGGNCVLDKEALAEYYVDMAIKHGNDVKFLWWHSHAKMKAFWSSTDLATMKEYSGSEWSAFLVVNVFEEYKFRVCAWKLGIEKDVELEIGSSGKSIPKSILDEVEAKCSNIVPTIVTPFAGGMGFKGTKYNVNQHNLFDQDVEMKDWNDSFYPISYEEKDLNVSNSSDWALYMIDELNSEYLQGAISYSKYSKKIKRYNKMLKKVKSEIRIILTGEASLNYDVMHIASSEFLENKNQGGLFNDRS